MSNNSSVIAVLPCLYCGKGTQHSIEVELAPPDVEPHEVKIGDSVDFLATPATIGSYVITPSLAFGVATCRQCDGTSYALVERRAGRLVSVRYWGTELPEGVEPPDELQSPGRRAT